MDKLALEIAAQCWCDPRVSDREMDSELATVFAEKLVPYLDALNAIMCNSGPHAIGGVFNLPEETGPHTREQRLESQIYMLNARARHVIVPLFNAQDKG